MQAQNRTRLIKQILGFVGAVGVSALIGFPGEAQMNPTSRPSQAPTATEAGSAEELTPAPEGAATPAPEASPSSEGATTPTEPETIVALASSNSSFEMLTAALKAAGLTETLSASGPFTVFAPTDAAFEALERQRPGILQELMKPENKAQLVKILTYHVVPGKVLSSDLKSGEVKTVEGSPVKVSIDAADKKVMVNNANVTQADIQASNGVIHAIDQVILPPMQTSSK